MGDILEKLKDKKNRAECLAFSEDRLPEIAEETSYLETAMNFTPIQSVLFSVILQKIYFLSI